MIKRRGFWTIVIFLYPTLVFCNVKQEVNELNDSAKTLLSTSRERAYVLTNIALKKAEDNNYKRGIAESHLNLGKYYRKGGFYDSSLQHYTRALSSCSFAQKDQLAFDIRNSLGILFKNQNQTDLALEQFNLALTYFDAKNQSITDRAKILNNIGNAFKKAAEYDSCLFYYFKCLDIYSEFEPNSSRVAVLHFNLGDVFQLIDEPSKALEYLERSKELFSILDQPYRVSKSYNSMGNVSYNVGKYNQALQYYLKALEIRNSIDGEQSSALLYNNIGSSYMGLTQYDSAFYYLQKALNISIENEDIEGVVAAKANLADCYLAQDKTLQSLEWNLQALALANKYGMPLEEKKISLNLSDVYMKLNEPDSALTYFKYYTSLKDSLFSSEKNRIIFEMEQKYRAQQSKRKISDLKVQNLKKNQYLLLLGTVFIIVLFIILFIWRFGKYRSRIQTEQITKVSLLAGAEKERENISRELHDHVGATLSMASMMISQAGSNQKKSLDNKIDESNTLEYNTRAGELVKNALGSIRKLSHELSSSVLKKFGLSVALSELANTLKGTDIKCSFEEHSTLSDADALEIPFQPELAMYRVTQELLNNVLKHAQATEVNLHLKRTPEMWILQVTDNGIGFDATRKGGLGIDNIRARIEPYKGSLQIESSVNQGSKMTITIHFSKKKIS